MPGMTDKPKRKITKQAPKRAIGAGKKTEPGTSKQSTADRRFAFIEAYLTNGGNGLQAAVTAGFSPNSAGVTACNLLKHPKVLAELTKRREALAEKIGLTTERTLMEVARIAYSDPRKFYNTDGSLKSILELDDDCAATIASVEWDEVKADGVVVGMTRKLKQWDKNAALEKAMKFHGAYERDNAQPNAALAQAVKDAASINALKAAFAKRLGRA